MNKLICAAVAVVLFMSGTGCAFSNKGGPDESGVRDTGGGVDSGADPGWDSSVADDTGNEQETNVDGTAPIDVAADAEPGRIVEVKPPESWIADLQLEPQHIHITFNRDSWNSAAIQWETPDKTVIDSYIPKVWLVKASDVPGADTSVFDDDRVIPMDRELVFEGTGYRYCQFFACDQETMSGLMWNVDLSGLEPDTWYYYRVGTWKSFDPATGMFSDATLSPPYHFRTGPEKGSDKAIQFGFGADSQNWVDDMVEVMSHIRSTTGKDNNFWLFGGDLTEVGIQEELWGWFEALAPILHYYPFMPVRGNHDILPLVVFGSFSLPEEPELEDDLKRGAWSFTYGNVHVAAFDSNGDYGVERQMAWLEQDLAAAAADPSIDWKIVIFHHPAYSSCNVHGSTDYIQRLACPIFDRYGVDVALSGHDHDYERTLPLRENGIREEGDGVVYVTAGGFFSKKCYGNGESDFTAVSLHGDMKNYLIFNVEGPNLLMTAYNGAHEVIDTWTATKAR